MKNVRILSTNCLATGQDELFELLDVAGRKTDGVTAVDFTNIHIVTLRHVDASFREKTEAMDYFVPDSKILTWMMNMRGADAQCHFGPRFMREYLQAGHDASHYFLGANTDCLNRLLSRFKDAGVNIVGAHNGYFDSRESASIVAEINRLSPDYIWIGLGTPRQQDWIHRNRLSIRRGVLMAVGYAFDVNAGTKKDAPPWMHRMGLVWLFRLLSEPRRLWWRYLKFNTLFLVFFAGQLLHGYTTTVIKKEPPGDGPRS